MTGEGRGPDEKIKLLIFAWGYSIHAERRIRVFAEDAAFEVWLASNYNYSNLDVHKVYLEGTVPVLASASEVAGTEGGDGSISSAQPGYFPKTALGALVRKIKDLLLSWQWLRRLYASLHELRAFARDYKRVRQCVREVEPDVLFSQTLMYPAFLPVLLPKRYPFVVTFWNGDILFWASYKGFERLLKKWIVCRGIRRARAITVNSDAMLKKVVALGGSDEKVHLIRYPGVDRSRFFPSDKSAALRRIGLSGKRIVLCPRGLGSYLNSDIILEAAALVCQEHKDVTFVFVSAAGGEPELQRHQAMARELGVEDHILFVGQIPWPDMPEYYRASEALVSISSKDSLPNCMLEGMACGVPLIIGDIPQLREWVEDQRNAFLVPPRDAEALASKLAQILSNKGSDELADMQSNNFKLVEDYFDSEKNVAKVKDLVGRLVEEP